MFFLMLFVESDGIIPKEKPMSTFISYFFKNKGQFPDLKIKLIIIRQIKFNNR